MSFPCLSEYGLYYILDEVTAVISFAWVISEKRSRSVFVKVTFNWKTNVLGTFFREFITLVKFQSIHLLFNLCEPFVYLFFIVFYIFYIFLHFKISVIEHKFGTIPAKCLRRRDIKNWKVVKVCEWFP